MSRRNFNNEQILYSARIQSIKRFRNTQIEEINMGDTSQKHFVQKMKLLNQQQTNFYKLKQVVLKNKARLLAHSFINKLKRMTTYRSPPPNFTQFKQAQVNKYKHLYQTNGFNFPSNVRLFISFAYLVGLILCFFIGSWQGFIQKFWTYQSGKPRVRALKALSTFFFLLYLILQFLGTKIQNGKSYKSLQSLAILNLKSLSTYIVLVTVVAGILFNIFLTQGYGIAMFCAVLLNVMNVYQIISQITLIYADTFYLKQYSRLIVLFCFNLVFAHLVASVLLAISFINGTDNGWLSPLQAQDWFVIYVWSFYWAATIMMTVGFGDYSARIWQQAIIIAFIQIAAVMVLAYIISEVMNIITDLKSYSTQIQTDLGTFKRMTRQNNISEELNLEIQSYIVESGSLRRLFQFREQKQLLDKLPEPLKRAYLVQSNRVIFQSLPFFKHLNPGTALIHFSNNVQAKIYYPNQRITSKNGQLQNITILKDGKIGLAYRRQGSKFNGIVLHQISVKIKKQLPILLNCDLLSQNKYTKIDILAQNYSFCYLLKYEHFIQGLKQFKLDYEYYFSTLHRHDIVQRLGSYGIQCQYCPSHNYVEDLICTGSHQHTLFECPKLHYMPLKDHIVRKDILKKNKFQQRQRNVKRGTRTLKKEMLQPLKLWKSFFKQCSLNWGFKKGGESQQYFYRRSKRQSDKFFNETNSNNFVKFQVASGLQLNLAQSRAEKILKQSFETIIIKYFNQNRQNQVYEQQSKNFHVDQAQNYTTYFLIANPSRLIEFPLGKQRRDKLCVVNFMHAQGQR